MTAQTKGVDVLAVWDAARAIIETSAPAHMQLTPGVALEARTAVAELIEANRALLDSSPAHMTHRNAKEREAYRAIRAALARVGGAP